MNGVAWHVLRAVGLLCAVVSGSFVSIVFFHEASHGEINESNHVTSLYDSTARGSGGGTLATAPTPPPDCYVASEPSQNGPNAPGDLIAFDQLSREVDVSWTDNSEDEACFVLEARLSRYDTGEYQPVAFLPPDTTEYTDGPYEDGDGIYYRVYAATATMRSAYSNVAHTEIPHYDGTVSPSPVYQRGDLNCDGVIDARDALPVLRDSAGLDPDLPSSCPSLHSVVHIHASGAVAAGLSLAAAGVLAGGMLYVRRRNDGREETV